MIKTISSFPLLIAFCLVSACAQADSDELNAASKEKNCQTDNRSLRAMPLVNVSFKRDDGSIFETQARLANTNATRAAGFQRVCASTIAAMPILFVFQTEQVPGFHMNNVVAPIDIAFIKKSGRLESIQAMQPYSVLQLRKPLWRPKQAVKYALEVHPGFFEKHNVNTTSRMTWSRADFDAVSDS